MNGHTQIVFFFHISQDRLSCAMVTNTKISVAPHIKDDCSPQ